MSRFISYGKYGVSSRLYLASYYGLKVLEEGGNVFDAAITISSLLSLLIPHTGGLGGDGFILGKLNNDEIIAYNGSGKTPKEFPSEDFIREKPIIGPLTVTVPGLVDLWMYIYEEYSTMDINYLLRPAISLAYNGFYLPEQTGYAIKSYRNKLSRFKNWNKVFGRLNTGDYIRFSKMGEVFKAIARYGWEGFYNSRYTEYIVEELNNEGVKISVEDFNRHSGYRFKPIKISYRDSEIYELPPNTQGITTLEILKMMENLELYKYDIESIDRISRYIKIAALAYRDRDKYIGDTRYIKEDYLKILSDKHINDLSNEIKLSYGDTTFFTLADKYGNILGFIQSIFYPFGSGIVAYEIPFQSRALGFKPIKGYVNSPAPEKRPLHTLSISYIDSGDKEYIVGCAGGELRPQIHSQIISNILDYKMSLSEAGNIWRYMLIEWRDEKAYKVVSEKNIKINAIEYVEYPSTNVGIVHTLYRRKGRIGLYADIRGGGIALAKY